MFRKLFKDDFYKILLKLVIPITLQGFVNQAVNSVDVFMLGSVGQDSLSAVSLANQVQFWVTGFFWGATGGTALMIAQYWGKRDRRSVQSVMGIGWKVSFLVTLLLTIVSLLFPTRLMTLFTDDPELVRIGVGYLRIICVTFVMQSITQIYECSLRSMERAGVSTLISSVALGSNVLLNALLIFGWFGLPKMGVTGIAIATVTARCLEVLLCMIDLFRDRTIRYEWKLLLGIDRALLKDFFNYSLPAMLNDISWTVAFSTYSIILGHLGSDMVAAAAVATTVRDLATVACMSLSSAAVTIIGNELGSGKTEQAKRDSRRIVVLALVSGAITGLCILLLRPLLLRIYPLTDTAGDYLRFMLAVSAYYVVGQCVNTVIIAGIFRAGGDTKFGMICDSVNMWCLAVPIGFLSAFVFNLPPKTVYFILCLDEFYKLPAEIIHYRKYKWAKNVTRDQEEIISI